MDDDMGNLKALKALCAVANELKRERDRAESVGIGHKKRADDWCDRHDKVSDELLTEIAKVDELTSRIIVLEATISRLLSNRPEIENGKDYLLKENKDWIVGITEREDGTFTSVWIRST